MHKQTHQRLAHQHMDTCDCVPLLSGSLVLVAHGLAEGPLSKSGRHQHPLSLRPSGSGARSGRLPHQCYC